MRMKKHRSATLIEIMLYTVILAIFLFAAMSFAIQVLNITSLSRNTNDLQTNVDFISESLITSIQSANAVNTEASSLDVASGVLSLGMQSASENPTIFTWNDTDLFVQQGAQAATRLNSDYVSVDSIEFHKISTEKAPDQIVIDAVFTPKGNDLSNLAQTIPFHISVSLRQ